MISPKGPGACTGLQFLEIAYSSKMAMAKIVNKDPLTQLFIQMGLTGLKEEEEEGGGVGDGDRKFFNHKVRYISSILLIYLVLTFAVCLKHGVMLRFSV